MNQKSSYIKFLEEEYAYRKLSLYEKVCNFFGMVKVPLPSFLTEKFQPEIDFCHLRVTSRGVFLTSVFIPLFLTVFLYSIFFTTGVFSTSMLLMLVMLSAIIFYYLFSYTHFLSIYFRSKASSEMALSVVYMAISLKITQNLESAVAFTASNLSGPLGLDLKKVMWDLETGRLVNVVDGLDELSRKWKSESEEFVDALTLLKNSVNEPPERAGRSLKEAVSLILEGTKNRMKKYALHMRSPLKILNTFGIMLPLLLMIFFPVMIIFVPEIAKPELIAFSYMVVLPFCLYLFLKQYFYTRPYSYHQVAVKRTEAFRRRKLVVSIAVLTICSPLIAFFIFQILLTKEIFTQSQFLNSLGVVATIALGIASYAFFSSLGFSKKNKAVLAVENELPTVLFQLSITSDIGKPFEKNIEDLHPRIRELEIDKFFQKIVRNIKVLGTSLEEAMFDRRVGAINDYPSTILSAVMKLVVDIASKGMAFLSLGLKSMSDFLKDANEVNATADEILSEVTSDMQVQAWVFAPVAAGIVVGLMAIVIYIFAFFSGSLVNMEKWFNTTGVGPAGMSGFEWLFNIQQQIPFPFFQIIVGVYMVEVVYMLANFLGELNYGDDEVSKLTNLGKLMLIAITIYSIAVCGLYFGISSIIDLTALKGLI